MWRASLCHLSLQLIGMLVFSALQYRRFNVTTDFASCSQAWAATPAGTSTLSACAVSGALLLFAAGFAGLVGPRGRRSAAFWTALGGLRGWSWWWRLGGRERDLE